jgi:FlaG/FlaF family flagellin (archaellin)
MKKGFRWNKKGISTVIATIIIVAIAIVMAISVAYWAMGIGTSFTRFEKLTYTSAYASGVNTNYTINFGLKNTGTASATIEPNTIYLNGQPLSSYNTATASFTTPQPIVSGGTFQGKITITDPAFQSGMTVEMTIQSTAGNQYPEVVVLP